MTFDVADLANQIHAVMVANSLWTIHYTADGFAYRITREITSASQKDAPQERLKIERTTHESGQP